MRKLLAVVVGVALLGASAGCGDPGERGKVLRLSDDKKYMDIDPEGPKPWYRTKRADGCDKGERYTVQHGDIICN